ncbi:hypothetical protein GCM10010182_10360 [Actinomadura cremea]|nr:hypothetical protein GCM10010182_10360 [Actinomadura cremea]
MSLPWRRKNQNSTPRDQPEEPERLSQRWAIILGFSIIGGGVAEAAGAAAEAAPPSPVTGVVVGLAIATGLHKILK